MSQGKIINEIYDTRDAALEASKKLGCNEGARKFLINGETKYVPCADVDSFSKAIRFKTVQGEIVPNGQEGKFGDKLVGLQFASKTAKKGDPFFTLGNFNITTSETREDEKESKFKLGRQLQPVSAEKLNVRNAQELEDKLKRGKQAKVNFDYTDFTAYTIYGSLKERIRTSIQEIFEKFPASLHLQRNNFFNSSVIDLSYDDFTNQTFLSLRATDISNPFNILFLKSDKQKSDFTFVDKIRNFAKYPDSYVLKYEGEEFSIKDVVFPENIGDEEFLKLKVDGNVFKGKFNADGTLNTSLHILPPRKKRNEIFEKLSDFSKYLLNENSNGEYISEFSVPRENFRGDIVKESQTVKFPKTDDHNLDLESSLFSSYLEELEAIGEQFDRYKTKLINRFLTDDTLQMFDTEDRKMYKLLETFGYQFDKTKQFIDGLAYMNKVSYDKINNVPDLLLKNFAHTVGFETFDKENIDSIIKGIFTIPDSEKTEQQRYTPYEIDSELWRRLVINAAYLFKSKGTRRSIQFALELVGIPESALEINEFVGKADRKLNYDFFSKVLPNIDFYPVDKEGFPTTPPNVRFQENGGYLVQDKKHTGPYDGGDEYIESFEKFDDLKAFDIDKVVDNKKSWVETNQFQLRREEEGTMNTDYSVENSRSVINLKNLNVFLSQPKAFDFSIYRFFERNDLPINKEISNVFQEELKPHQTSFYTFIRRAIGQYINVQNRKVSPSYPTLSKLYFEYRKQAQSRGEGYIGTSNSLEFLKFFDTAWLEIVKQFTPATSILTGGKKVGNSEFLRNKFQYPHGKNDDVNWLGTDGSEFQSIATKPVNLSRTSPFKIEMEEKQQTDALLKPAILKAKRFEKTSAIGDTNNTAEGFYYSNKDFIDNVSGSSTYNVASGGFISFVQSVSSGFTEAFNEINRIYFTPQPLTHVCKYENQKVISSPDDLLSSNTSNLFNGTISNKFTSGTTTYKLPKTPVELNSSNIKFKTKGVEFEETGKTSSNTTSIEYKNTFNLTGKTILIKIKIKYENDEVIKPTCKLRLIDDNDNIITEGNELSTAGTHYEFLKTDKGKNKIQIVFYTYNDFIHRTLGYYYDDKIKSAYKTNIGTFYTPDKPKGYSLNSVDNLIIQSLNAYKVPQYGDFAVKQPIDFKDGKNYNLFDYVQDLKSRSGTTGNTTQLMHTNPVIHAMRDVRNQNEIEINLTKEANVKNVVYDGEDAIVPSGNEIKDNFYLDDSLNSSIDGFYLNNDLDTSGPFYNIQEFDKSHPVISENQICQAGVENAIQLTEFQGSATTETLSLAENRSPTVFVVEENGFFKFEAELIFENNVTINQDVSVLIRNQNDEILNTETFSITSSGTTRERTKTIEFENFLLAGDEVFVYVKPFEENCTVKRQETLNTPVQLEFDQTGADFGLKTLIDADEDDKLITNVRYENGIAVAWGPPQTFYVTHNGFDFESHSDLNIESRLNDVVIPKSSGGSNAEIIGLSDNQAYKIKADKNTGRILNKSSVGPINSATFSGDPSFTGNFAEAAGISSTSGTTDYLNDIFAIDNSQSNYRYHYIRGRNRDFFYFYNPEEVLSNLFSGATNLNEKPTSICFFDAHISGQSPTNNLAIGGSEGQLRLVGIDEKSPKGSPSFATYNVLNYDFKDSSVSGKTISTIKQIQKDANDEKDYLGVIFETGEVAIKIFPDLKLTGNLSGNIKEFVADEKVNSSLLTKNGHIADGREIKQLYYDSGNDILYLTPLGSTDSEIIDIASDSKNDFLIVTEDNKVQKFLDYPSVKQNFIFPEGQLEDNLLIKTFTSSNYFNKSDSYLLKSFNGDVHFNFFNSFYDKNPQFLNENKKNPSANININEDYQLEKISNISIKVGKVKPFNYSMHKNLTFWRRQENFFSEGIRRNPIAIVSQQNSAYYQKTINQNSGNTFNSFDGEYEFIRENNDEKIDWIEDVYKKFYESEETKNTFGNAFLTVNKANEVILKYIFDKNDIGDARSGEFFAKVILNNVCGEEAAIYINLLLVQRDERDLPDEDILNKIGDRDIPDIFSIINKKTSKDNSNNQGTA